MLISKNQPRSVTSMKDLRWRLKEKMVAVAEDPAWQDAWANAEGLPTEEGAASASASGKKKRKAMVATPTVATAVRLAGGMGPAAASTSAAGAAAQPSASGAASVSASLAAPVSASGAGAASASASGAAPAPASGAAPAPASASASGATPALASAPGAAASSSSAVPSASASGAASGSASGAGSAAAQAHAPPSFMEHVRSLDQDALDKITSTVEAFCAAEMEWGRAHPKVGKRGANKRVQPSSTHTSLRHRIAIGHSFNKWRATEEGKASKSFVSDWCKRHKDYDDINVPEKKKQFVRRCSKLAQREVDEGLNAGEMRVWSKRKKSNASQRTPARLLRNLRGGGRRRYGGPLSEQLWDWFVDNRASVAYNLPPKFLLMKAKAIANSVCNAMRKTRCFVSMPRLSGKTGSDWLRRWCRDCLNE